MTHVYRLRFWDIQNKMNWNGLYGIRKENNGLLKKQLAPSLWEMRSPCGFVLRLTCIGSSPKPPRRSKFLTRVNLHVSFENVQKKSSFFHFPKTPYQRFYKYAWMRQIRVQWRRRLDNHFTSLIRSPTSQESTLSLRTMLSEHQSYQVQCIFMCVYFYQCS